MRLSMFKEELPVLTVPSPLEWARPRWRQSLDKGMLPQLASLQLEWLKEYPELDFPQGDLEAWISGLHGDWLKPLLARDDLREIFAHGPQLIESVGVARGEVSFPMPKEDWSLWVETLALKMGAEFNFSQPCSSLFWNAEGSSWRVTLLHASLAGEAKVFLRRLGSAPRALVEFGVDAAGEALLRDCISQRENMLVAGSTGSGKTTFMTSLLAHADPEDHLVMLEDTRELCYEGPRSTRLLARPQVSLSDLLAHTLRLSPDRIILGEMRSHEVVPFLLAMNTGHKGVMSTLHASSAMDSLHRVAQLFTLASGRKEMDYGQVLKLVSKNVGVVVFVEKRQVKEVIRVYGCEEGQPLYDVLWRK